MKIKLMFIIAIFVLLITGCFHEDDNSNGAFDLQGEWETDCVNSSVSEFVFSGNMYSYSLLDYTYSSCTSREVAVGYSKKGTYSVGRSLTTSSGLAATEINLITSGGEIEYQIYSFSNGKLFFGDINGEYDGITAAKRPIDLVFDFGFSRKK